MLAIDLLASARDLRLAVFWGVVGVIGLELAVRADWLVGYVGALAVFYALGLTRETDLYRYRPYRFAAVCASVGIAEVAVGATVNDVAAYATGAITLGWGAFDVITQKIGRGTAVSR
jgi:hypothetical protein